MKRYINDPRPEGGGAVSSGCVADALFRWSRHFPAFVAWDGFYARIADAQAAFRWPLPNVWLGVSTENQEQADARIPHLLKTPAAVRFVSAEPLLGEIDFSAFLPGRPNTHWSGRADDDPRSEWGLDWIIGGGKSGAGARPCRVEWIRSIVRQCKAADVPVFVKQLGSNAMGSALIDAPPFPCSVEMTWNGAGVGSYSVKFNNRKGGNMSEWPEDLRIREMPK